MDTQHYLQQTWGGGILGTLTWGRFSPEFVVLLAIFAFVVALLWLNTHA